MTQELLRSRADRGQPRGAAAVWAGANRQFEQTNRHTLGRRSPAPFRLAMAAAALLLVAATATVITRTPAADPPVATDTADSGERDDSDGASPSEPEPILIDGMTLDNVFRPLGLDECCDEAVIEEVVVGSGMPIGRPGSGERSFAVFADPDQPFDGPIAVIETLAGPGFQLSVANRDRAPADAVVDAVVRTEIDGSDGWTLDASSGLVEVARFEESTTERLRFGWQFDFVSDQSERATLQAEPDNDGAGVWRWIARTTTGYAGEEAVTSSVDVLGATGVALENPSRGDAEVYWATGGQIYRLTAGRVAGDSGEPIPATAFVDRLRIVERADWQAAVDDATNISIGERLVGGIPLIGLVAVITAGGYFLLRKPLTRFGGSRNLGQ